MPKSTEMGRARVWTICNINRTGRAERGEALRLVALRRHVGAKSGLLADQQFLRVAQRNLLALKNDLLVTKRGLVNVQIIERLGVQAAASGRQLLDLRLDTLDLSLDLLDGGDALDHVAAHLLQLSAHLELLVGPLGNTR